MTQFKNFVQKSIEENSNLKSEIMDFYQLALDEIEEGGSKEHEIDLAINSIEELINENKK